MRRTAMGTDDIARVNGVALHAPGEALAREDLRQRACTELLRQAAHRDGSLAAADLPASDGAISEAAAAAIEAHLERAVHVPAPTEEACRRYFAAHAREYVVGERLHLRHVLFAVTPGVNVAALRERAAATLVDVRASGTLAEVARTLSNCPSGRHGGELGWLAAAECAPEFARIVFAHGGLGVLPQLVHSRHGFHVVEIVAREPGTMPSFEAVRAAVAATLERQAFVTALRQYLQVLAGAATLEGVDLDATATPLVQ
ncbi:MAG: peptidylprolyl isomerase [Burkholderiales bacterium]|nr:peptidylprolyl isomerase [Burkholderiales bacterium]